MKVNTEEYFSNCVMKNVFDSFFASLNYQLARNINIFLKKEQI